MAAEIERPRTPAGLNQAARRPVGGTGTNEPAAVCQFLMQK